MPQARSAIPQAPLDLGFVHESRFEAGDKSIPTLALGRRLDELGGLALNVLEGDVPLPAALLKTSALHHNRAWMRRYLARTGVSIAPHGKTTMAPQLFSLQLEDGAWGMTAATIAHVQLYRRAGVRRIIVANQVIGTHDLDVLLDEIHSDPSCDIYFLLDSVAGFERAFECASTCRRRIRPLRVLLEVGLEGGRGGVRGRAAALTLARRIAKAAPHIELAGIECYEGILGGNDARETEARISELLGAVADVYAAASRESLFAPGERLLTAGGTAYFDLVSAALTRIAGPYTTIVLRSGCYLTLDHGFYAGQIGALLGRLGANAPPDRLMPALEVGALVNSVPEPTLAILNFGKRDAPYDLGLPVPLWRHRRGDAPGSVTLLPPGCTTERLNDQHAYVRIPAGAFEVGDVGGFGISHPCSLFDRWPHVLEVDDRYTVTGAIKTFF